MPVHRVGVAAVATDARIPVLVRTLSDGGYTVENRVDAASLLMHIDKHLAENLIVRLLEAAAPPHFDFYAELLDVLLGEWVLQGKTDEMEALLDRLPVELRSYAESAWKNLMRLKR